MKKDEFKSYLINHSKLSDRPIDDCISRCKRIEKNLGNLDELYALDKLESIIEKLTFDLDCILINGDKKKGMASLKNAAKKYQEFCLWYIEPTEFSFK